MREINNSIISKTRDFRIFLDRQSQQSTLEATEDRKMKEQKKVDKVVIKTVRPWVKATLAVSALVSLYGLARQSGLLQDRVTEVQFDAKAIQEIARSKQHRQ